MLRGRRGHNLRGVQSTDRFYQALDAHYAWKGDEAQPETKRQRLRRRTILHDCERCGAPATDRHHKDGDTGHNDADNIEQLCRRCHMLLDGRLAKLGYEVHPGIQEPKPCCICGRPYKPLRQLRCAACYVYWQRTGTEWTPQVKTTKQRHVGPIDMLHRKNK